MATSTIKKAFTKAAVDVSNCATLDELHAMLRYRTDVAGYGDIGALENTALKSVITQPASFHNYTGVVVEWFFGNNYRLFAFDKYSSQCAVGYLYGNNTQAIQSGWQVL